MDELDRLAAEAENFTRARLDKKRAEIEEEVKDYDFRNLLDAANFLFELRAKRHKSVKDEALIEIIEDVLEEQPFEYCDEDFILSAFSND